MQSTYGSVALPLPISDISRLYRLRKAPRNVLNEEEEGKVEKNIFMSLRACGKTIHIAATLSRALGSNTTATSLMIVITETWGQCKAHISVVNSLHFILCRVDGVCEMSLVRFKILSSLFNHHVNTSLVEESRFYVPVIFMWTMVPWLSRSCSYY